MLEAALYQRSFLLILCAAYPTTIPLSLLLMAIQRCLHSLQCLFCMEKFKIICFVCLRTSFPRPLHLGAYASAFILYLPAILNDIVLLPIKSPVVANSCSLQLETNFRCLFIFFICPQSSICLAVSNDCNRKFI